MPSHVEAICRVHRLKIRINLCDTAKTSFTVQCGCSSPSFLPSPYLCLQALKHANNSKMSMFVGLAREDHLDVDSFLVEVKAFLGVKVHKSECLQSGKKPVITLPTQ